MAGSNGSKAASCATSTRSPSEIDTRIAAYLAAHAGAGHSQQEHEHEHRIPIATSPPATASPSRKWTAPDRDGAPEGYDEKTAADLEAVFDVPVRISVVLGPHQDAGSPACCSMDIGTVVELDRQVGEAVEIFVNDRLVARGEIVLVENRLGVTMTEIIKPQ